MSGNLLGHKKQNRNGGNGFGRVKFSWSWSKTEATGIDAALVSCMLLVSIY